MTANDSTPNPLQPLADALAPLLLRHLDKRVEATAGDAAQAAIDDYEPDVTSEVEEAVSEALTSLTIGDLDGLTEDDIQYLIERAVEGIDTGRMDDEDVYRALRPYMRSLLNGSDCSDGDPFRAAMLSVVARGLGLDLGTNDRDELARLTRRDRETLSPAFGAAAKKDPALTYGPEGHGWGRPDNPDHPSGWLIKQARQEQQLKAISGGGKLYPSPWLTTGGLGEDPTEWPHAARMLWLHRRIDDPSDLSRLGTAQGPDDIRGEWGHEVGREVFNRLRALFSFLPCEVVAYPDDQRPGGVTHALSPVPLERRTNVSFEALSRVTQVVPVLGIRPWYAWLSGDAEEYPSIAGLPHVARRGMGSKDTGPSPAAPDAPGAWNGALLAAALRRCWGGWDREQVTTLARRLLCLNGSVMSQRWGMSAWDQDCSRHPAHGDTAHLFPTIGWAWANLRGTPDEPAPADTVAANRPLPGCDWRAPFTVLDEGRGRTAFPFRATAHAEGEPCMVGSIPEGTVLSPRRVTRLDFI